MRDCVGYYLISFCMYDIDININNIYLCIVEWLIEYDEPKHKKTKINW